jgi:hypothetical protein
MNKLDFNIGLVGEYKVKITNNNTIKFESDWSRNTILSGGLVSLYNNNITDLLGYVDFGTSTDLKGSLGYKLSGIITPQSDSNFINVPRITANTSTSYDSLSTVIHYNVYSAIPAATDLEINEFSVKSGINSSAFARNVFAEPILLSKNDSLEFIYRLKLNWNTNSKTSLQFNTIDNYTYYVPITSQVYQVPYADRTYKTGSKLILSKNNESLPRFGRNYPNPVVYGIINKGYSTFNSTELGGSINHNTRTYTVSTAFYNISSTPIGIFKDINSLLLTRDDTVDKGSKFFISRLKFPLVLYRTPTANFNNLNINCECCEATDIYAVASSFMNFFTYYINYSWSEA